MAIKKKPIIKEITYSFKCSPKEYTSVDLEHKTNERIKKRIIDRMIRDRLIDFSWHTDKEKNEMTIKASIKIIQP